MRLIRAPNELAGQPVAVAIGVFDGVHLGHQQVLSHALADAWECNGIALAVTFDKHPSKIIAPERAPRLIYPLSQKLREIERFGIDATWLITFDEAFSLGSAHEFVRKLATDFHPLKSISVGESISFGHKRQGNVTLLRSMAQEFGFEVNPVPEVDSAGGKIISSSRIREAIRTGQIAEASSLLGRPYSIAGKVIEGQKIGRQLGYPTANIDVTDLVLPPTGVYAITTQIDGRKIQGAANLGFRPTVLNSSPELAFEVHLLDWQGDLYGRDVEITIGRRLRGEMKFASIDDLKNQIAADLRQAASQNDPSKPIK